MIEKNIKKDKKEGGKEKKSSSVRKSGSGLIPSEMADVLSEMFNIVPVEGMDQLSFVINRVTEKEGLTGAAYRKFVKYSKAGEKIYRILEGKPRATALIEKNEISKAMVKSAFQDYALMKKKLVVKPSKEEFDEILMNASLKNESVLYASEKLCEYVGYNKTFPDLPELYERKSADYIEKIEGYDRLTIPGLTAYCQEILKVTREHIATRAYEYKIKERGQFVQDEEYCAQFFAHMFMQIVFGAEFPGLSRRSAFVLMSNQGTGKTTIFKHIIPRELTKFVDNEFIKNEGRNRYVACQAKLLVVWDDVNRYSLKPEDVKSFITKDEYETKELHKTSEVARYKCQYTNIFLTNNFEMPIRDDTGQTRFWVLESKLPQNKFFSFEYKKFAQEAMLEYAIPAYKGLHEQIKRFDNKRICIDAKLDTWRDKRPDEKVSDLDKEKMLSLQTIIPEIMTDTRAEYQDDYEPMDDIDNVLKVISGRFKGLIKDDMCWGYAAQTHQDYIEMAAEMRTVIKGGNFTRITKAIEKYVGGRKHSSQIRIDGGTSKQIYLYNVPEDTNITSKFLQKNMKKIHPSSYEGDDENQRKYK